MASVTVQRDLVVNLKRETYLNVGILSKLQPMPSELSRQIFKDNALEKPTQNVFNNLSHYLVSIIDHQVSEKFTWPLYDTKAERVYRNQLSAFITDYSSKGLVSPVMSSYLVNPGCYKVVMLVFQMSQLAVQRLLMSRMIKDNQKQLYMHMTDKYKNSPVGFVDCIDKETEIVLSKFSNYLRKREAMEKIAAIFRDRIVEMERKLELLKAQQLIDDIVDNYVSQHSFDEATKSEILQIKNVNKSSKFFDTWLKYYDEQIEDIESKWNEKVSPLIEICSNTQRNSESVIARQTGEAEQNSFMIEYNSENDVICTKELQKEVNSQQNYILKNIVRDDKLNFPNLIRGFLISICYILKNNEIGDEIFKFNEYLESGRRNFSEVVSAMRILNERVMNAEAKLQPSQLLYESTVSVKEFDIPPLPDLSDVKANWDVACQVLLDTFTPISISKHQFNLRRKCNSFSFSKPQPRSTLITPFHPPPRDDFLRSLISCRVSSYDNPNVSHNFHNISVIPQVNPRANETIAECSSGFTKQQIMRLLSTKKSTSSKKFKYKTERPDINVKKGGLFNDTNYSNDSNGLFRSYSSPNLYENKEKRPVTKAGRRKLSIMQEDSPSLLEVSGIAVLENNESCGTPDGIGEFAGSRKLIDTANLPVLSIKPDAENKINKILNEIEVDLKKEIKGNTELLPVLKDSRISIESREGSKTETPKTNSSLIRKTNSLEKIISRFKKVRANILPDNNEDNEFRTIVEEKENMNTVNLDVFTANRILLPDLLSPSCSMVTIKSTDYLDQLCMDMDEKEHRKPRESLGTALGVDNTFLDQFDLID